MSRGRFVRRALGLAAVLAVVLAAWLGWQAWQVNTSLRESVDDATALRDALANGDSAAADRALSSLQGHSGEAADHTGGHSWSLLTRLPAVGDDAEGVRTVSEVLVDLSKGGLPPLVDSAGDLSGLLPVQGAVDIDGVRALAEPVGVAREGFARAADRLAEHDPEGFVGSLRDKYSELTDEVSRGSAALAAADRAIQVLPGMLGGDGPRDYLLVFQNNAEIRATGGLPGAISVVHTDGGKITMSRQVAASSFGEAPASALPLTKAEKAIYGPQLGTYFLDANFTPDFPRSAALMKARWEQVYDEQIDGVFAVDPVALSYILGATGPVQVGDSSLTEDTIVDELLHEAYVRLPDPTAQDEFFRAVAAATFNKVTAGTDSTRGLLEALNRSAGEHRLYVHSFDESEQGKLTGSEVAGELVTDPTAPPQVGVYLDDNTGAKMSYYLRTSVKVSATYCNDGRQGLAGKATLTSTAPTDVGALNDTVTGGGQYGIAVGSQLVAVHLYGPQGGSLERVTLNGNPVEDVDIVDQDGRKVANVFVFLDPQQVVDLTWTMTTAQGQLGDIQVAVTPGVEARRSSFTTAGAC